MISVVILDLHCVNVRSYTNHVISAILEINSIELY